MIGCKLHFLVNLGSKIPHRACEMTIPHPGFWFGDRVELCEASVCLAADSKPRTICDGVCLLKERYTTGYNTVSFQS